MAKEENYLPKTKEEFEAYCRAVDAANDDVLQNASRRETTEKSIRTETE